MMEVISQAASDLTVYGMCFGLCLGAFTYLATSALCAVVHLFKRLAEGRG